ncbi:HTH tetR-type domain-containing protein [uncultured Thiomicrorhabdus sp.]
MTQAKIKTKEPPSLVGHSTLSRLRAKKRGKTANKILATATEMFAETGFGGSTMDELCARSGVNKASIYYHFGDKAGLYEVALTELFKSVVEPVLQTVAQAQGSRNQLHAFIESFAQQASLTPTMPAVLMREIASGGMNMPIAAREQMQRLLFALKVILQQGEEDGIFKESDPLTTHFMILGSLCFFITSEPMRLAIPAEKKLDPSLDETIQQLTSMVEAALLIANKEDENV